MNAWSKVIWRAFSHVARPDGLQAFPDGVHRAHLVPRLAGARGEIRQTERWDGDGGNVVRLGDQLRWLDQDDAHADAPGFWLAGADWRCPSCGTRTPP